MENPLASVMDKIEQQVVDSLSSHSLRAWIEIYIQIHVKGAPFKTQQAKAQDINKFLRFFQQEMGHDHIDGWTPAVTKQFQLHLLKTFSSQTKKTFKETTVNRVLATLRHMARWVHKQRPFLAGSPFQGVRDIQVNGHLWNGLTARQVMRLKSACEQRIQACQRLDQNPLLETAVFYVLLQTGLRESELVALNISQYHHRGLHDVLRPKNKRVTKKVPLPHEAREFLDRYLMTRCHALSEEPLFVSRYAKRLATQDVRRICQRLLKQATAFLTPEEKFRFTPHMLRHTFLKRVTDKHGVHFAQAVSGNVSIREIFRYAQPSQTEIDNKIEEIY